MFCLYFKIFIWHVLVSIYFWLSYVFNMIYILLIYLYIFGDFGVYICLQMWFTTFLIWCLHLFTCMIYFFSVWSTSTVGLIIFFLIIVSIFAKVCLFVLDWWWFKIKLKLCLSVYIVAYKYFDLVSISTHIGRL